MYQTFKVSFHLVDTGLSLVTDALFVLIKEGSFLRRVSM